jgi:hypothetical protein
VVIVAVEGPSAAGKTTWCRQHTRDFVAEYAPTGTEPDGTDLHGQAAYWVAVNSAALGRGTWTGAAEWSCGLRQ